MRPDPETREFTLVSLHPGATVERAREATGWDLEVAKRLDETEPPTREELEICATCGREPRPRVRGRSREAARTIMFGTRGFATVIEKVA